MRVGQVVGLLALASLALVPWWVLWEGWSWWVLAAAVWWLVVGLIALFDAQQYRKRR